MKQLFLLFAALLMHAVLIAQNGFKQLPSGLNYKIVKTGAGVLPKTNNAVQVHTIQAIGDSAIFSTYSTGPSLIGLNKASLQNDFVRIFTMMRAGDSAVFFQTAKAIKKQMNALPPFMQEKDTLFGYCKMVKIFPSLKSGMLEKQKEANVQLVKEQADLKKHLEEKNLPHKPTPTGCFINITNPGTGAAVKKGATVSVMYRGQRLDGVVFDTNMDASFGHTDPLVFPAMSGSMIPGFDEAVGMLKKGGKCRVYIPATLGYGQNGSGELIKPGDALVFDLELTDIQAPAPLPQQAAPPPQKVKPTVKPKPARRG
jgi:FKBP-type peptidyl-prolyl cis-trans isomerase FkpA